MLSQVFHFVLMSSYLMILSKSSIVEQKYKKIEGCEQSIIIANRATKPQFSTALVAGLKWPLATAKF